MWGYSVPTHCRIFGIPGWCPPDVSIASQSGTNQTHLSSHTYGHGYPRLGSDPPGRTIARSLDTRALLGIAK